MIGLDMPVSRHIAWQRPKLPRRNAICGPA
jgi:hypothetical protein